MTRSIRWMIAGAVALMLGVGTVLMATPAQAQDSDLEGVAAIIDVLFTGDEDAIRPLIGYSQYPCDPEPTGIGANPMCLEGEEEGTLVNGLPIGFCEGVIVREEEIDDMLGLLATPGPVFEGAYAVPEGQFFGEYVVLYTGWYEGAPDRAFGVSITDGLITNLSGGCGENVEEYVAAYLGTKLELPSAGPGLPSTGYGASEAAPSLHPWMVAFAFFGVLLVSGSAFALVRDRRNKP